VHKELGALCQRICKNCSNNKHLIDVQILQQ
jgi:hypothetical protein